MDKRMEFDAELKAALKLDTSIYITSRDLFEEAWMKMQQTHTKSGYKNPIRRIILLAACFLILSFGTAMAVSADVRDAAIKVYEKIKTTFIVEREGDSYKIVEKTEEDTLRVVSFSSHSFTPSGAEFVKKKVGFNFYIPEKIGNDFWYYNSGLLLAVYDVKLRDVLKLEDKFQVAAADDETLQELSGFKTERCIGVRYYDANANYYILYIFSAKNKTGSDKESSWKEINKLNIEDIECTQYEYPYPVYENKILTYADRPIRVETKTAFVWEYEDKVYSLQGIRDADYSTVEKFVKGYIKEIKNQN
ncbi:MAG: hypothetical protein N2484_02085 [Clostridia bacterium]|nr:hypothetical protein [Clostridia bacterium]